MKFLSRVISTILASTMLCGISISANAVEINENEIINQEQSTEISTEQPTETNSNAFSHFEQSTENPSQAETDTPYIFKPDKDVVVESSATTWQSAYINYINTKTSTYPNSVYRLIDVDKNGIPELFHDTQVGYAGQYVVGFYNGTSKIVNLGVDGLVYYYGGRIFSRYGRQGYYYDDCYTVTSSNITRVWAGEYYIPYYASSEGDGDYYIINTSTGYKSYVSYGYYYTSLIGAFYMPPAVCVNETTSYNKSQIINKINQTSSGVTSVKLNKTSITLGVGESYTLTKTITPSNVSTSYSWLTSKSSVATVSSTGKITAKAVGTSTITVRTSNGKTATCTVTVKNAPSKVSLNKTSLTLGIGEQYDLNSSLPSGTASYSVVYSSNNTAVASVAAAGGLVTAKKVGTATITARTYNGKTAQCYITVKNAPSKVSLNKTSLTLGVGEQYDLNSSLPSGTASYSVVYSSNNSSVASVAAAGGMVTAKSVGYATVTARTYNGKTVNCYITVKKAPSQIHIDSPYIKYEKEKLTLLVGEKFDFNSRLNDGAAAYHISYSSSNSNVCSVVSAGGLATAKSAGTATIKATTYNGKTVTCTVVVKSSIPSKRVYLRDFSILVPDRCVYSSSNTGISIYDKYNYNNFGWQYGFYGTLTDIVSYSHFESSDHPGFMKNLGYANGNYYVQLRPTDVQWCCDNRFTVSQQNEARKQYEDSYSYMYYIVDSIRWY